MRLPIASFLTLSFLAGSCASYRIAIEPPPHELAARAGAACRPLGISLQSTYAPYENGELSTTDLYPRDSELGARELHRYREALLSTQRFESVAKGEPGKGLHCALTVVSGREPARKGRCILSFFLFGLLSHEQREIVRIQAVVTAPGRSAQTYRLEGRITTDAIMDIHVGLHRDFLDGPEKDIAMALASHMEKNGWLDTAEVGR